MRRDEIGGIEAYGEARQIDRRAIAKGVAWTVPVVIVATAAPAAAASGGVTITASRADGSVTFSFTNEGARPAAVTITAITPGSEWDLAAARATVPSGKTRTITVVDKAPTAQYLTVSYSVDAKGYASAVYVSSSVNLP